MPSSMMPSGGDGCDLEVLVGAVRVDQQRRQVAGHRELDLAGDRVVDPVGAGREVRLALADVLHELVELLQRRRRGQLEHRQGLDRGAQPSHRDRGADAVPGHVADDQRDPRAGQPDRLVPVAADLDQLAAGQVTVADVDRGGIGQAGRQHRPLQRERGRVLPVVPGGVVEEDRLAGGEVHRHFHVVPVEPAGAELPEAAEQADHGALGDGRQDQHGGVGEQPADRLAPPRAGELPGRLRGDGRLEDRLAGGDAARRRGSCREAEDLADRERGLPGRVLLVVLDVQPAERDVRRRGRARGPRCRRSATRGRAPRRRCRRRAPTARSSSWRGR